MDRFINCAIAATLMCLLSCAHGEHTHGTGAIEVSIQSQERLFSSLIQNDSTKILFGETIKEIDSICLQKFKTCHAIQFSAKRYWKWFLTGRVYEEKREYEAAIISFLKAEAHRYSVDKEYVVWLYFALERIFNEYSSIFNAYDASKNALTFAKLSSRQEDYGIALCDCACNATMLGIYYDVIAYLDEFKKLFSEESKIYPEYYRAKMIQCQFFETHSDSAMFYAKRYLDTSEVPDLLPCILTGLRVENYSFADSLINVYSDRITLSESLPAVYYWSKSKVEEQKGEYLAAYQNALKENQLINKEFKSILISDPSTISERFYLKAANSAIQIWAMVLFSIATIIILSVYIKYLINSSKYKILEQQYKRIKSVYDAHCFLFPKAEGLAGLERCIREMGESIGLSGSEELSRICSKLVNLSGASDFAKHLAMMAEIHCEQFVAALKSKNLSPYEVGYSLLLMLGFKTSELKGILNRTNVYNRNVEIRNKLEVADKNNSLYQVLFDLYTLTENQ